MRSRFKIKLNVAYQLRDKDGNLKPIFSENGLWKFLHKLGLINPNWTFLQTIPFLFGSWSNQKVISNLVTTVGKALVAGRINGSGAPAAADYIAVGTGTNAAAAGDTTLQTEITDSGLGRAQGTVSLQTTDTTNDTARVTKSFSVTGTKAVTEAGLLNASSNGTLLARQVFSAINVVNGDTLAVTWDLDVD